MASRPGKNRVKSAFFALFLPFSPYPGRPEQRLGNPENGGKKALFPQTFADLLKPPSLKPPFAALQLLGVASLAEKLCKKDPCNFNTEMFGFKVGNPCPTLRQLLASWILYVLLVGEKRYEISRQDLDSQSCSKVGQLLVNSSVFLNWGTRISTEQSIWAHPNATCFPTSSL